MFFHKGDAVALSRSSTTHLEIEYKQSQRAFIPADGPSGIEPACAFAAFIAKVTGTPLQRMGGFERNAALGAKRGEDNWETFPTSVAQGMGLPPVQLLAAVQTLPGEHQIQQCSGDISILNINIHCTFCPSCKLEQRVYRIAGGEIVFYDYTALQ